MGMMGGAVALAACKGAPKGPLAGAPKEGEIVLPAGGTMPTRRLGRTGATVSLLGIGGFHIGVPKDEQEAITIVRKAIDHGVTFLDNCWDYNGGQSEVRMGKALQDGYRKKVFLMTKLDGRMKASAAAQLEQSLQRMKTDVIDLVQVHEVIRKEDPERVFGPGGAIEALLEAKKAGKIRFIGFTGHKDPDIHLAMLRTAKEHGFTFDTVQMPINVMDAHYRSFAENVLPALKEDDVGVLGMKPIGSGILLESKVVSARECLEYAMSTSPGVVITGCDSVGVLDQALDVAMRWKPMADDMRTALLEKTRAAGSKGDYEKFKTSDKFDGTKTNPKWLEGAEI